MTERYEVRRFTTDRIDDAAGLLAERHRHARIRLPALDPSYESAERAGSALAALDGLNDATGAIAYAAGKPAGYVLMTPRPAEDWGPNAWAEDVGCAGEPEAIRAAYAMVSGELMERGVNRHYAVVPASEDELVDAWFTLSFGLQQVYAFRASVGSDFQPWAHDGLTIRRAEDRDVRALAGLHLVLPNHVRKAPVFASVTPPTVEAAEAEAAEDIHNPKYTIFVAELEGRVIATTVGCAIEVSDSWKRLMRPAHAGLLGYAATLPDARGLGAGRALCENFFVWARDEGYEWLACDWRSTNVEANRTWHAMGFRPLYLRLHRAIT